MAIIESRGNPLWKRLAWFVLLWAAGVGSLATAAYALRWWLSQSVSG